MFPDWVKELASLSPAAIFAFLWWTEREERKSANGKVEALLRETLTTNGELVRVVDRVLAGPKA